MLNFIRAHIICRFFGHKLTNGNWERGWRFNYKYPWNHYSTCGCIKCKKVFKDWDELWGKKKKWISK
jgi:hypothetical protein